MTYLKDRLSKFIAWLRALAWETRCIQPYCDTIGLVDGFGRCPKCAKWPMVVQVDVQVHERVQSPFPAMSIQQNDFYWWLDTSALELEKYYNISINMHQDGSYECSVNGELRRDVFFVVNTNDPTTRVKQNFDLLEVPDVG